MKIADGQMKNEIKEMKAEIKEKWKRQTERNSLYI